MNENDLLEIYEKTIIILKFDENIKSKALNLFDSLDDCRQEFFYKRYKSLLKFDKNKSNYYTFTRLVLSSFLIDTYRKKEKTIKTISLQTVEKGDLNDLYK